MAEACGVIFFNVDYRLAPEAKCPENVKDFYSALKYVVRRALDTLNTQMSENVKDFYSALKYVVRRVLDTLKAQMIS